MGDDMTDMRATAACLLLYRRTDRQFRGKNGMSVIGKDLSESPLPIRLSGQAALRPNLDHPAKRSSLQELP
jgi:hypothetical protein